MKKKDKPSKPRKQGYRCIEDMVEDIYDDWRRNWNWLRENPVNGW